MRRSRERVIYYSSDHCNPFVRNVLKSVFCVDKKKVVFIRGEQNACRRFLVKKDLTECIERIYQAGDIEKVLEDTALMEMLARLVRRKKQLPGALAEIMYAKYPKSVQSETKNRAAADCYVERWNCFYGDETFRFKTSSGVNSVNYDETETYLKLFEKQKLSMEHMDNATATLLLTLPCDADTIADIGAGPGLVNQFIPYYYDVLAVDLNEKILKQNSRKTCIGDVLDLPLEDQSVDMTITCDVLEHIEPEKINQAVCELQRVSRKYIYIQTPYNEILRYSVAKCPKCGNIWHVNFHKSKFTFDTLKNYETKEWRISQINFTGHVCNETESAAIYEKIENEQMDIYRVDHFECPKCGAQSQTVNTAMLEEMEKRDNRKENGWEIAPKYSEIGVLFEKTCPEEKCAVKSRNTDLRSAERLRVDRQNRLDNAVYSNMEIEFGRNFLLKKVYTGKEQIPVIFEGACQIEKTNRGIVVKGQENSWLGISLPYTIAQAKIELKGSCKQNMDMILVGVDFEENEFKETQKRIRKGSFRYVHKMSDKWEEHSTFFKIYCKDEYELFTLKVHGKEEKKYYFFTQEDVEHNHDSYTDHGVMYRYYIPRQGVAFEKVQEQTGQTGWKVI